MNYVSGVEEMNMSPQDFLEIDTESSLIEFPKRDFNKCRHISVLIDSKSNELVCRKCEAKVNAVIWIKDNIEYFARLQSQAKETRDKLTADQNELKSRARTRCTHCKKMTAINLKYHNFVVLW